MAETQLPVDALAVDEVSTDDLISERWNSTIELFKELRADAVDSELCTQETVDRLRLDNASLALIEDLPPHVLLTYSVIMIGSAGPLVDKLAETTQDEFDEICATASAFLEKPGTRAKIRKLCRYAAFFREMARTSLTPQTGA